MTETAGVPAAIIESDGRLVQIIDLALLDTTKKSGEWLVCRSGCTQCCYGAFAISPLDAMRLRRELALLTEKDAARAGRIRGRAAEYVNRHMHDFPGDRANGILDESEEGKARFEEFADDEPCPALDPATGACEVYAARPMTCRVFGPPIRSEEGLGVCELCYHGATDEEISACEMEVDPDDLEAALLAELQAVTGAHGQTIVAYCLLS
ncbi:MAG TPA: YkgJ family cysteine cluster protein [Acidisarcina sp.]